MAAAASTWGGLIVLSDGPGISPGSIVPVLHLEATANFHALTDQNKP
ncbi:hypothetical protein SXCC_03573 [Gluconacetobacter sp. SXCC-1]|nr:hypothetical protein SXCC_03573 [Gluconacetobacter sp. SXCC-1]